MSHSLHCFFLSKQEQDQIGWARARGGWVVAATYAGSITEQDLLEAEVVLATLWRVDDPSTAIFMRAFYQGLAAGCSPVIALRNAQLACLHNVQNPSLRHPYFWAGFQLITYVSQDAK